MGLSVDLTKIVYSVARFCAHLFAAFLIFFSYIAGFVFAAVGCGFQKGMIDFNEAD